MKKVLFTILAAAISLSACRKSQNNLPVTGNQSEQVTEADFADSRATVAGGHFKKNDNGLEMDYDLVIKEVSENKYVAAVKIKGLTINGKDVKGSKDEVLRGIVISINNLKTDPATPLVAVLVTQEVSGVSLDNSSTGTEKWDILKLSADMKQKAKGNVYTFPEFTCKDDLTYEVLDISMSVTPDNPTFQPAGNIFNSAISMLGVVINPNTSINITSGSFEIKENSQMTVDGSNMNVGFGMMLYKDGITTLTDRQDYFVLASGHTVAQDPELSKAKVEGKDGYVNLVFTGDPAQEITTVTYQPDAVSANNPKDPKEMITFPVMKFKLSHFNQKNGVQRFISTQKWSDLYKTAPGKTGGIISTNLARSYSRAGI